MNGKERYSPQDIKQAGPKELKITWKDGHESLYKVRDLRIICPCAMCIDELTGRRMLVPEMIPDDVHPVSISPVGRYAITINWTDGHSTGIYTFEYLRKLCPCDECVSLLEIAEAKNYA